MYVSNDGCMNSKSWFFDLWAKFSIFDTGAAQLQPNRSRSKRRSRCRSKQRRRSRLQTECDRVRFPLSRNRQEVAGLESHRVTSGRLAGQSSWLKRNFGSRPMPWAP